MVRHRNFSWFTREGCATRRERRELSSSRQQQATCVEFSQADSCRFATVSVAGRPRRRRSAPRGKCPKMASVIERRSSRPQNEGAASMSGNLGGEKSPWMDRAPAGRKRLTGATDSSAE